MTRRVEKDSVAFRGWLELGFGCTEAEGSCFRCVEVTDRESRWSCCGADGSGQRGGR